MVHFFSPEFSTRNPQSHVKKCKLQMIACEFSHMGCFNSVLKSDLSTHNEIFMARHVGYMKLEMKTMRKTIKKQETTIEDLSKTVGELTKRLDVLDTEQKSSFVTRARPVFFSLPNIPPLSRMNNCRRKRRQGRRDHRTQISERVDCLWKCVGQTASEKNQRDCLFRRACHPCYE